MENFESLSKFNQNTSKISESKSDWRTELKSALRDTKSLEEFFDTSFPKTNYPILIPAHYAKKIQNYGINSPLGLQYLPRVEEKLSPGLIDPIGDQIKNQGNGLIHRYENRVLFTPTTICPINCRFCFRKNELSQTPENFKSSFEEIEKYLKTHPEVEEVIFTGGDPFILANQKLANYLDLFERLKIKFVRFHSKTPLHLPSRFDQETLDLIENYKSKFQEFILVIHCNHHHELEDLDSLFKNLNLCFSQVLCQSVLLKNINDDPLVLKDLIDRLISLKIRPYYLHHPDNVKGAQHFMVDKEIGLTIHRKVRDIVPGWALPQYVIDSDSAKGKSYV